MKKIDKIIKKETLYILYLSAILSLFMQSVFLILNKWDYTILLGNLFGLFITVGNFFFMAYNLQLSLNKQPENAKRQIKLSQSLRLFAMFILSAVAYLIFRSNIYAFISAIIPYLFPRIAIVLRPIFKKD